MFEVEFADSILTIEHTLTNIKTTCEVSCSKEIYKRATLTVSVFNKQFASQRCHSNNFNIGQLYEWRKFNKRSSGRFWT